MSNLTVTNPVDTFMQSTTVAQMLAAVGASAVNTRNYGKTLWVDSVNGSDITGTTGRKDLPFSGLIAARNAATSGDVVFVLPGTYPVTDSILKNGVNWAFCPGCIVTKSDNSGVGILDDKGVAITCKVVGDGDFTYTKTAGTAVSGLIRTNHASSNVFVECYQANMTGVSSDTNTTSCVRGDQGILNVAAKKDIINSTTGTYNVGIWWGNGTLYVSGRKLIAQYGYWAITDSTLTGEAFVQFSEASPYVIVPGSAIVLHAGGSQPGASWLRIERCYAANWTAEGSAKLYLTCQKVSLLQMGVGGTSISYITAQKIEASDAASQINATDNSKVFLDFQHLDTTSVVGSAFALYASLYARIYCRILSGEPTAMSITVGDPENPSSDSYIEVSGGNITKKATLYVAGTLRLNSVRFDTLNQCVEIFGGALILNVVTFVTQDLEAISATDPQGVRVYSAVSNQSYSANITEQIGATIFNADVI